MPSDGSSAVFSERPSFSISLPTIHGGEVLQRVFFIGLPGHCYVCGRKGHLAADCTRRRHSQQQQVVADVEEKSNKVVEDQPTQDGNVDQHIQDASAGTTKQRSEG